MGFFAQLASRKRRKLSVLRNPPLGGDVLVSVREIIRSDLGGGLVSVRVVFVNGSFSVSSRSRKKKDTLLEVKSTLLPLNILPNKRTQKKKKISPSLA